jgi:hypothetical protein
MLNGVGTGEGLPQPSGTETSDATERLAMLEAYLRTSPQNPIFDAFPRLSDTQSGYGPVWSEEAVRAFRGQLVDSGLLPEVSTVAQISEADLVRLQSIPLAQRLKAIDIGRANLARRTSGEPEVPGGVKFESWQVNNRTGERTPVAAPITPKPPTAPPGATKP